MRNLCKVQARDRLAGDTHWDSQTHVASPSQGPSGISSACRDGERLRVAASHLIWLRISRPSLNHLPLGYCCFALCTVVFFFPVQNTLMSGGGLPRDPLEDPRYRTEAGTWMPLNWGPVSRPGLPHQSQGQWPYLLPISTLDGRESWAQHSFPSWQRQRWNQLLIFRQVCSGYNAVGNRIYDVLNHLSFVWLFATPWSGARQASLSMRFSRQEYWSEVAMPLSKNIW